MSRRNIALFSVALVIGAAIPSRAAELKQETLCAWEHYLNGARARMANRAKGRFLWVDEAEDRLNRVRSGEVVVAPVDGRKPLPVPDGLIHDWVGAAFIPGARIDDVLGVVRDYDHYTEFYKPSVVDAKTLSRKTGEDQFSVIVLDKAMFMKSALDSQYDSRFVQVDDRRWYSVAETTRVRELAGFSQPDEHLLPDGEGSGYIWRLCTISRYEERDGGVYLETEVMALSRPIPAALHWLVDPIVRRVSRDTLTMSLQQTRDATGSAVRTAAALTASRRGLARRAGTNE